MTRRVNTIIALSLFAALAGAGTVLATTQQVFAASGQNLSPAASPVRAHFNPKEIKIDRVVPWQKKQQRARTLKLRPRTATHRAKRRVR